MKQESERVPRYVRGGHNFLVFGRTVLLTLAVLALLSYFAGPAALRVVTVTCVGIEYSDYLFSGYPFSRLIVSLFLASVLSLGDSLLPKASLQNRCLVLVCVVGGIVVGLAVYFLLSIPGLCSVYG